MHMQATLRVCLTDNKEEMIWCPDLLPCRARTEFAFWLVHFLSTEALLGCWCCRSTRRDGIDWVECILNQGVPEKIVCSLISLYACHFYLFKFKSILEALIWGSVLGKRGKVPSTIEQQKRFRMTSVDIPYSVIPYSVSLKTGFLHLVSRELKLAAGKVKVRERVLSKTLIHSTYMSMSWTVSYSLNSYVEVLTLNVSEYKLIWKQNLCR